MFSRKELRISYEWLKHWEEMSLSGKYPQEYVQFFSEQAKREKQKIRKDSRTHFDKLSAPLSEKWRTRYDKDGESAIDYRIIPDNGQTDEEIRDYILEEVGHPPICSPYDCTGKPFMMWTHFARTPSGIVLIHSWGIDI